MPPRSTATVTRIADRRRRIAELYLSRHSQNEIAELVKVPQSTVSQDLKAVRAEWLARSVADFGQQQAEKLAELDYVKREALAAWERSKLAAVETSSETTTDAPTVIKVTRKEKHRDGDQAFLAIVEKCIEAQCKILGIPSQVPPPPAPPVVVVMSPAVFAAALALEQAVANDDTHSQSARPISLIPGSIGAPVLQVGAAPLRDPNVPDGAPSGFVETS